MDFEEELAPTTCPCEQCKRNALSSPSQNSVICSSLPRNFNEMVADGAKRMRHSAFSHIARGVEFDFGNGKVCHANQAILEAESPVFKNLIKTFGTELAVPPERQYKYEPFCEMIRFLHIGEYPCFRKHAEELLWYSKEVNCY